ncbi:MAG: cell envelope integrity protein TolA, partial [Cetobacterium sp.]
MKFFIFSIVLHIFIFIFGFSLDSNKSFEINNVGNDFTTPSISVNFNSMQITPQPQPTESSDEILKEILEEKVEEKIDKPKFEEKKREVIKKDNKKISKPKKVLEKKKNEL